ncbi:MAG: 50S ribosome-binding GTPase, partial [Alphaproteobacteria bacterium]
MFRIALAGRPNVGKSSLFNRLLPRALSLVEDTPGVTRDWIEGTTTLGEYAVALVDTAGLQGELGRVRGGLEGDIQDYNLAACRVSDLIWFMVDARAGLLPEDETLARDLRRMDIPILLIANKCENRQESRAFGVEVLRLGFGEAVMVSAAHGLGIEDLVAETLEIMRGEIIRGEADTEQGTDEGAGESEG